MVVQSTCTRLPKVYWLAALRRSWSCSSVVAVFGNDDRKLLVPDYQTISRRLVLVHEAADEEQTLDNIITFALSSFSCDMGGVMIRTKGSVETFGATHAIVHQAD